MLKTLKNDIEFIKWGIAVKYFGLIGKIFKSEKHLDKSVYYMDKRWCMAMNKLRK